MGIATHYTSSRHSGVHLNAYLAYTIIIWSHDRQVSVLFCSDAFGIHRHQRDKISVGWPGQVRTKKLDPMCAPQSALPPTWLHLNSLSNLPLNFNCTFPKIGNKWKLNGWGQLYFPLSGILIYASISSVYDCLLEFILTFLRTVSFFQFSQKKRGFIRR